ncbi:exonuclease domain-containing protein [Brevibacterium sp. HMSC22B09]|uniref:exonuclease domain-containing protein n=1 Tax=Brevibacterium sp. HMSC22B09 TaxID=1581055 RepID=UPI0008A6596C|nr:exonuclease domain-containing protein [Brevibacterium sp. HMSC22B09]OFT97267.1 hypothetical protein HMPREF3087_05560 [Brevibacterium sp. HMSC22B09]
MKQLTPEHQVNIRCVSGIETLLSEHFGNRSSQDLNQPRVDVAIGLQPGSQLVGKTWAANLLKTVKGQMHMNGLNFAVLDVETANRSRASICQLGVTIVRNGQIEQTYETYVVPPTGLGTFDPRNVSIHGIEPEHVADAPTWDFVDTVTRRLLQGLPVIAHNADFDRSAYYEACTAVGLDHPSFNWLCSLQLVRQELGYGNASLGHAAKVYGIPLDNAHTAGADSRATAAVILAIAKQRRASTLEKVWQGVPQLRAFTPVRESETVRPRFTSSKYQRVADLPEANSGAPQDGPFYGETVVISGVFDDVPRDTVIDRIAEVGAYPRLNFTKKTTVLIRAEHTGNPVEGLELGTGKEKAAAKALAEGRSIRVLNGEDALRELGLKSKPRKTQSTKPTLPHRPAPQNRATARQGNLQSSSGPSPLVNSDLRWWNDPARNLDDFPKKWWVTFAFDGKKFETSAKMVQRTYPKAVAILLQVTLWSIVLLGLIGFPFGLLISVPAGAFAIFALVMNRRVKTVRQLWNQTPRRISVIAIKPQPNKLRK